MQGIPGMNEYLSDDSEEVPKINIKANQITNPMLSGYEPMELNSSVNPSGYDNLSPAITESSQKLPFLEKDDSVLAPTIPESTTHQPTETPVWQNTYAASETYESSPFAIPNPPMIKATERQFDMSSQNNIPFFTENPMLAGPPESSSSQTQQVFSNGPTVVARPVQVTSIEDGLEEKKAKKKQAKKSKLSKEKKKHKSDSRGKKKNGNPGKSIKKAENPARKRKASEANLFLDMPAEKLRHMTRNNRVQIKGWEQKFLKALNKYKTSGEKEKMSLHFFWQTVDPELHAAPNYYKIIQYPMDFGKIHDNLKSQKYESIGEVMRDCELVFCNARIYNKPGNFVYEESKRAQKLFCCKKKSGFYKLVQSYGTQNDKIAFDTRHGLGDYGPFCYDPEFDHKDPRFNNETFI